MINLVQSAYPTKTWSSITPTLYITFWSLSLYDIDFPKSFYNMCMTKIDNQIKYLKDERHDNRE